MALEKFDLSSLEVMDGGRVAVAYRQALSRAEADCADRPAVQTARKVTLTMYLQPIPNPEGDLDTVDVGFDVTEQLPKRRSKVYNMRATGHGLVYNDLSQEDANQATLDEAGLEFRSRVDEEKRKKGGA